MLKITHTPTGQEHLLIEEEANDWLEDYPTDKTVDIFVSEGVGTIDGSIFCYWVGDKDIDSPEVLSAIQSHLSDHDVVGVRYIRALPTQVYSSLS